MTTSGQGLFGMATILASLILATKAMPINQGPPRGTPVLLSHRCTNEELSNLGDGRMFFIRLQSDHSSTVNENFRPVEADLRREVARIMSTRYEQVIYFAAADTLSYQDVSTAFQTYAPTTPN